MVLGLDDRLPSLLSYKYFIRPTAKVLYGNPSSINKTKHQENIQKLLWILAMNGPLTTWDMAKIQFPNELDIVRTKEKEFRRLLVGRTDRGKFSDGILDLKLVVVDSLSNKRNPGKKYRLSIYGVLFCLDILNLSHSEVDILAKNYGFLLPKVFGKWDFLKSKIAFNVYNITMLGKGMLFDNPQTIKILNKEFASLISYFNVKSSNTSLTEEKISDLVSLWFFTTILYFPNLLTETTNRKTPSKILNTIFKKDKELGLWFSKFVDESKEYYHKNYQIINKFSFS